MHHIILLSLFFAASAPCAILIENIDASGTSGTVLISGHHARINHAIPEGYMLPDLANDQAYAVNAKDRYVIDLSTPFVQHSAARRAQ